MGWTPGWLQDLLRVGSVRGKEPLQWWLAAEDAGWVAWSRDWILSSVGGFCRWASSVESTCVLWSEKPPAPGVLAWGLPSAAFLLLADELPEPLVSQCLFVRP